MILRQVSTTVTIGEVMDGIHVGELFGSKISFMKPDMRMREYCSTKGFLEVEYTRETLEPEYDSLVKKGTDAQV